ncbi:hypothetical protein [Ktedonobacter racemifer]|uniref:Uncharacterized protein n=1 Tax=Ktedonobacter racemifer DSM 44963 TaxID=485913 RepID=D6TZ96_KTERA|nr:hypothetical protein [Ktedonobacter racemifer]EFH81886.1 hypothetical protein Krac_2645 [Ktedonobacter racemifer DSM 44963]
MLSLQVLFRLSGFGLISASGLIILAHICQLLSGQNDMLALAGGLLLLVGGLIVCLCLPALFLRQVPGVGIGGLIGFIGFSLGMFLLNIDATMLNVFLVPWLANMDPKLAQGPDGLGGLFLVSSLLQLVGGIIFCLSSLRTEIFPRWPVLLLLATLLVQAIGGTLQEAGIVTLIASLVFYCALVWMSMTLLKAPEAFSDREASFSEARA